MASDILITTLTNNFISNENTRSLDNKEVNDINILLQQLIAKINSFGIQYSVIENELKSSIKNSQELEHRCTVLQLEIDTLKNQTCPKCPKLKKYILSNRQKTKEVESRLLSIANILNVKNKDSISIAHTLASQAFSGESKSEKRTYHDEDNDENSEISFEELYHSCKSNSCEELNQISSIEMTPKKQKTGIESEEFSPVIETDLKQLKHKGLNSSPLKENQNLTVKNKSLAPLSVNMINNNKLPKNQKSVPSQCNNVSNKGNNKNDTAVEKKVWSMKKDRDILASNKQKLKQMTLAVTVGTEHDISKIPEFNGGFQQSKLEEDFTDNIANETLFIPTASSTNLEMKDIEQNNITENELEKQISENMKLNNDSPPYKYRRDAIKKPSERLKLPGQDCQNCYQYYKQKANEMTSSQIKGLMNKCSRHRDKYAIRTSTPPGFWNPRFDDTKDV